MSLLRSVPGYLPGTLRCFFTVRSAFLRKWFAPVFLVSCLCLAGCTQNGPKADLVIINGPDPESLDPAIITAQADGRAVQCLFEGLTRYNARTAEPEPGIAERWDVSDDGRTYTFYLRTNAVWSTGEAITADDFVYSWRRVLNPATGCQYSAVLFYVKNGEVFATGALKDPEQIGVKATGSHTLVVELNDPAPFFLDLCAYSTLAVVPRRSIEKYGDAWVLSGTLPVSGAYQLESWRLNDRIRLRKNPRYWDAANTSLETVDLLPCQSANTALNLYESGQADIVWDKELVPSELIDVLRDRTDFHRFDYLGSYFVRFNVTRKPFDDARVRKALALAIDRDRVVSKITKAGERAADHLVPPGIPGYQSPAGLRHNPRLARELLAEAGFPGGKGFPLVHYLYNNTGRAHEQIGIEFQEMWKRELGIHVELRKLETPVYFRAQDTLDYDICRGSWIGDYNDANTFLDLFLSNNGNNRTGWKNPQYDELLRQANGERNRQKRSELLQTAERLLIYEEAPIMPVYIYSGLEYYNSERVKGIFSNVRGEHPVRAIWKASNSGGSQANDR